MDNLLTTTCAPPPFFILISMQLAPLTHSNESSQSPRSLSSDPTVATQQQQQHEIMAAEGSSEPPGVTKPKPHQCQICGRGFTTGGHLQRHQRIHTGVKAFKCPYPGCETRTSRQDNLQQQSVIFCNEPRNSRLIFKLPNASLT